MTAQRQYTAAPTCTGLRARRGGGQRDGCAMRLQTGRWAAIDAGTRVFFSFLVLIYLIKAFCFYSKIGYFLCFQVLRYYLSFEIEIRYFSYLTLLTFVAED